MSPSYRLIQNVALKMPPSNRLTHNVSVKMSHSKCLTFKMHVAHLWVKNDPHHYLKF